MTYLDRDTSRHPDDHAVSVPQIPRPRHPYPERTIADIDASLDNARIRKLHSGPHAQQSIMDSIDRLLDYRLVLMIKEIVDGPRGT